MDGDKDKPTRSFIRFIDYYRTPEAKFHPHTPSKVMNKKVARRYRRRTSKHMIKEIDEGY